MMLLTERYHTAIRGTISCFDRVVLNGTLPDICHAAAMASELTRRSIRLFDYTKFAEPLRDEIRKNAEAIAAKHGLTIEFIGKKTFRKEERIKKIIAERNVTSGLVHIFSAMEPCPSFYPWHDKQNHKTMLKSRSAKCIHYYFYFIDPNLGLCYLRVPTWAPFRLQFYFNGHYWLANQLTKQNVPYQLVDNAFVSIDDFEHAQKLADAFDIKKLHRLLDTYAKQFCPVIEKFGRGVHWSIMQAEYATDIVFKRREDLAKIYEPLVRTAIHDVKAEHVATFLGRKIDGRFQGEVGNDFHTRVMGTRIKHHMQQAAIKMYDKHGIVLRIETTVNNVSFFKHRRKVEHRDKTTTVKYATMRKTIYSLGVLTQIMGAANRRYLEFISALDTPESGIKELEKLSAPSKENNRSYRGFNLFYTDDIDVLIALMRGEFNIYGIANRRLQPVLEKTSAQISRVLKRLRLHGIIKKVGHTYKYYLTKFGKQVVACALRLRQQVVIPSLAMSIPVTPKS